MVIVVVLAVSGSALPLLQGTDVTIAPKKGSRVSWFRSFLILLRRNASNTVRNPGNLASRVIMTTTVALLTGSAYQNLTNGADNVRRRRRRSLVCLPVC